jgi:flagellar biosynthesis protein FlhF
MNAPVRIKTFRSKTLHGALELIRQELGPDAAILETKACRGMFLGNRRVEVTASSQVSASAEDSSIREDTETTSEVTDLTGHGRSNATDTNSQVASPPDTVLGVDGNFNGQRISRIRSQVRKELLEAGLAISIIDQWLEAIQIQARHHVWQDVWTLKRELQSWVEGMVPCAPWSELPYKPGDSIALVGPPGAGKTTVALKLAAQLASQSEATIGFLQIDPRQFGVSQAVQQHCDLLGWQAQSIADTSELQSALRKLASADFLLVDANGCSPSDEPSLKLLEGILAELQPTSIQVVIPSTCSERMFLRYLESLEGLKAQGLILTKLDESGSLGPLFCSLASMSIPATFLADSSRTSDPLHAATAKRLAQSLFGMTA